MISPKHGCSSTGWATPSFRRAASRLSCRVGTADFIARELTAKPGKRTVEERIAKWPTIPLYRHLQSTGVRIEQGLAAIDNDIDDGPMIEAVLAFIADIAPDIHARAPRRYGGGTFKLALFVQKADEGAELAFSKKRSHKWFRPGETPENSKGQCIEIFGGAPARNGNCAGHMGVWGPHSYDENDNEVKTYYRWDKGFQALNEVALVDLPMLTTAQANQIIDHFDKLAEEAGWVQEKRQDTGDAAVVYSITDASRFNTNLGGVNIDYDGLCAEFDIYGRELRCSTSFLGAADRDSKRLDHCAVDDNNRHGVVAVWVYGEQQLHFPASLAPPSLDQLPGLLKDLVATTPPSTFFAELDGALTQDSVAQIFAQRFKDQLRYCHHTGAWFRWADTHWQREQTALAFDICRKLSREISRGSGTNVMKEARKVGFAGGVERFAKADRAFAVTSEIWDRDPFLLGTPGGTVDLRTGVLRAADPADGITKLTAVTPADHADCPRWKRFLEETFGDDAELIRLLYQAMVRLQPDRRHPRGSARVRIRQRQ